MPFSKIGTSFAFFHQQGPRPSSLSSQRQPLVFPTLFEHFLRYPGVKSSQPVGLNTSKLPKYCCNWFCPRLGWNLIPLSLTCIMPITWSQVTSFSQDWCKKRHEALWAFAASVNSFLSLMSNALAFDFLLPLMYLPNDFLLLAMLLLVKFYLLYWLFCVCPRVFLLGGTSALTPWKPDLLSLCFLFALWAHDLARSVASYPSQISSAMGSFGTGLLETPSYLSLSFPTKGKRPRHGLGLAGRDGEGKRTLGMEVSKFWGKRNLTEESKELKTWKGWEGKEGPLEEGPP